MVCIVGGGCTEVKRKQEFEDLECLIYDSRVFGVRGPMIIGDTCGQNGKRRWSIGNNDESSFGDWR